MLRFILIILFVFVYLVLGIPVLLVEWVIGKCNPDIKTRSTLRMVQWAFSVILFLAGTNVTVIGLEKVPKDRPVLYVANHRSYFDILVTYRLVNRPTGYIAKKEMEHYFLLRDWMRCLHCLFLDRGDTRQGLETIQKGIEEIKSGLSVCIFPEGKRNKEEGTFLPFHQGSFRIAEKTGCPVVPIAINNTAFVFEEHYPFVRKTHVVVEYGDPIYTEELPRDENKKLAETARERIIKMNEKN